MWLPFPEALVLPTIGTTTMGGHCICKLSQLKQLGLADRAANCIDTVVVFDVVAEESTRLGSSRVRKLIHVGLEWGVRLNSGLRLGNLNLGLILGYASRVLNEGLVRVGGARRDPSDA
ncbi:hypothetical protein B296_00049421 [Ensete ventricosum]|uniref:Uncharacterized protein n=1 Tax=Ensete ventricosum TaxID=4639 RepID=A0A426XCV2_ENSVE|nr:hypothetical protein B296_00049421 [Ensete ventricosum]